tara:strand:- start:113 stop:727 length:615 start_codon:yes stop_codon:yes gene_type:complete
MTIFLFFQIVLVCLLGAVSPGPSMVVVINNAIFKNKFNGIITALGHGFGIGIYALFAVLGIGIIIETNLVLFKIIKIISILFLFYLGIHALVRKNKLDFKEHKFIDGRQSFLQGLMISILNPKILIWFMAIYSQFMSVNNDIYLDVSLVLIASVVDALWYVILVNLVTSREIIELIKNKVHVIQKLIGFIFIIISVFLLIDLIK